MGRAPCCSKVGLQTGPWTPREDASLIKYIQAYGEGQWKSLPKKAGLLRCGKSCRLRWVNYLRPDIKRGNITAEEDDLIIRMHSLLGNRWSLIAGRLPGRTDNEIKNYWNTHLSKKLKNNQDPNLPADPDQQEAAACSAKKKKNNNNNKKQKQEKNKLKANNAEAPKIQVYMPKPIRLKALSSNLPRTDNGCSLSTVDILNSSSCASTTNLENQEGRKEEEEEVMVNNVVWEDGEQHEVVNDILNIEWELCHVPTATEHGTLEKLYEEYLHLLTMDDSSQFQFQDSLLG